LKKWGLYIILFLFAQLTLKGQEFLIHQFPALDTVEKTHGPNRATYIANIVGFGCLFGPTDSSGSNVNPQQSVYYTYGARIKTKVTEFFHYGSDFFLEYRNFNIRQNDDKVFADPFEHKKERYVQLTINLGLYTRFNFSKRGNHLGKYLDLFFNGTYSPVNRYYVYDKIPSGSGARNQKQVFSKLEFANKLWGQVGLRYGISFFQFQAFYRPFNMFKNTQKFPYPELPRFGLGILIDIESDNL